jgi:tetratricopeptide (TPR) repeat protein
MLNKPGTSSVKNPLSTSKKWAFQFLLIFLPISFFILLELFLKAISYGEDLSLFIPYHENEYLLIANSNVSLRYFSEKDMTGFGTVDSFWKQKKPNTKRIFVLGGSTTAGYPYFFNGGFPTMLRDLLNSAYPDYELEVINLGMTAVNSYTVRDFAKECLNYSPDLLLIYAGHNEFYGALGTGSNQGSLFQSLGGRNAVLAYIQLKQLKIYQLFQKIIRILRPTPNLTKSPGVETLMSKMAKEQEIPFNSEIYIRTMQNFGENLKDIIQWTEEKDIPVLVGTLVSNLRDQKPFISLIKDPTKKEKLQNRLKVIKALMIEGKYSEALSVIEDQIQLHPYYAILQFYAGRCSEFLGRIKDSKVFYKNARDYDGLRFRAASGLNEQIISLENVNNMFIANVEKMMESESKNGLIGKEYILEHLHPSLEGNFILSKTFANAILNYDILNTGVRNSSSDSLYRENTGVTQVDFSTAKYRINILTSGWPFKKHNRFVKLVDLNPATLEDSVAIDLLANKKSYWEAHIYTADRYKDIGKSRETLKEYEALVKAFPNVWKSYKALAEYQIDLNLLDEALINLKKAVLLGGDMYCCKMAGSILIQNKKAKEGIPYLERAIELAPGDAQARFNLSGAYYMLGDIENAKTELEHIIRTQPNYTRAKTFYHQILDAESHPDN